MISICALLLVATVFGEDNTTTPTADVRVDFVGNSGKIKLYAGSDPNTFIMISQSKLAETDSTGKTVNSRNVQLSSTDGSWSALQHQTQNGTDYYASTYTSTFEVDKQGNNDGTTVTFQLTAHLYQKPANISYGNTTIIVKENTLKFSVWVTGWPAFGDGNTLNYAITLSSKGGDNGGNLKTEGKDKKVETDSGSLDLPTLALADDEPVNVGISLDSNGGKQSINFVFPALENTLYYDPTMTVYYSEPAGEDSSASIGSFSAAILAGLALLL